MVELSTKSRHIADLKALIEAIHSHDEAAVERMSQFDRVNILFHDVLNAGPEESLLPPQAAPLRRRLEKVLHLNRMGAMACGDYSTLLTEIVDFNEPGTFTQPSNAAILREVSELILAKASGGADVTVSSSELAAWGNTIRRALIERKSGPGAH